MERELGPATKLHYRTAERLLGFCLKALDPGDESDEFAGLMIVRAPEGKEPEFLLVQRSADEETRADEWEIPGGHLKIDEDVVAGAYREADEEIGPLPDDLETVYQEEVHNDGADINFTYVVALTDDPDWEPDLGVGHQDWAWTTADALPDGIHPGLREKVDEWLGTGTLELSGISVTEPGIDRGDAYRIFNRLPPNATKAQIDQEYKRLLRLHPEGVADIREAYYMALSQIPVNFSDEMPPL